MSTARSAPPARPGVDVRTAVYEGPLDLLLALVAKHEVDIHALSISDLVAEFVAEVERMRTDPASGFDLETASHFLLVAATLMHLKSARLLPVPGDDELDDDMLAASERDLLLSRLLANATFQRVARILVERLEASEPYVARAGGLEPSHRRLVPDTPLSVTAEELARLAIAQFLATRARHVDTSHLSSLGASVGDAMLAVHQQLRGGATLDFRTLTQHCATRVDVVVHFLALLELYREAVLDWRQTGTFGEIRVWWTGPADFTPPATEFDLVEPRPQPEQQ